MAISIEDGLCCPDCSTMECLIVLPEDTTSCPSCGNKTLLNSAEMMARIHQVHRVAIEITPIEMLGRVPTKWVCDPRAPTKWVCDPRAAHDVVCDPMVSHQWVGPEGRNDPSKRVCAPRSQNEADLEIRARGCDLSTRGRCRGSKLT